MLSAEDFLKNMTPELYRRFKRAVEIRKWPDGKILSDQQVEICMQAIIAYEHSYVPETERTGYVPPKEKPCGTHEHALNGVDRPAGDSPAGTQESSQPMKWQ